MAFYVKRGDARKIRIYDVFTSRETALKCGIVYNLFCSITESLVFSSTLDSELKAFIATLKESWDAIGSDVTKQLVWRKELIELVDSLDVGSLQDYFDSTKNKAYPCEIKQITNDKPTIDNCYPDLDAEDLHDDDEEDSSSSEESDLIGSDDEEEEEDDD